MTKSIQTLRLRIVTSTLILVLLACVSLFLVFEGPRRSFENWMGDASSNLGGIVAALVAATVGVAGAYWAAQAATEAGIRQADKLENQRVRRVAESDHLRSVSKELSRIAVGAQEVTFSWMKRKHSHNEMRFLTRVELDKLHSYANEARTLLSVPTRSDRSIELCWSLVHNAADAFQWALEKIDAFNEMDPEQRDSAQVRARTFLSFEGVTDEMFSELGEAGGDWLYYAPPVQRSDMPVFKAAERFLVDGTRNLFHMTLMESASILQRASDTRFAEGYVAGETTDVLGIHEFGWKFLDQEASLSNSRSRLIEATEWCIELSGSTLGARIRGSAGSSSN